MKLTTEQNNIVIAPSGNILVSAAAGSGKTSVMTERIVKHILDRELSVEHMLVMTFTNAAAANMSAKLEKRLREKLSETKEKGERKYLSEQIAALPTAYISTINAFCSRVISNFSAQSRDEEGNLLLEPRSMILEETHAKRLLMDAFDEVFSEAYDFCRKVEEDPELASSVMPTQSGATPIGVLVSKELTAAEWAKSFLSMVASFGSGRDDTKLKEDMEGKLAYLRSLPDYAGWITSALENKKKESEAFTDSEMYKEIFSITKEAVRTRLEVIPKLRALIPEVNFVKTAKTNEERKQSFLEWIVFLEENGRKILEDPSITWNDIYAMGSRVPSDKLPTYKLSDDPALVEFDSMSSDFYELAYILSGQKKNADIVDGLKSETRYFFGKTQEEVEMELRSMYPLYERFFEMVLAADRIYQEKKRLEHGMDFPDQEQVALSLLSNPEVSSYYRDLFDEIYIDEYQDNSGVQDAIVQCFAKDNVFFVGDVKQSIYRFRHAKPQMFLDRSELYRDGKAGTLFTLNNNFRSVPGILSSVNEIFGKIMSEEYADIEYDGSHALNPGRLEQGYTETSGAAVTLILAQDSEPAAEESDQDGSDDSEDILDMKDAEKVQKEALIVAEKIEELHKLEGFAYEKCVVLTTSNRGAMAAADVLMKKGIPAQGPNPGNLLAHPDLRVMLDLARLSDNAFQDIPLAGVMKSKIRQAGFTDEDLLKIYLFSASAEKRNLPFCEKLVYYAEEADTHLAKHVQHFLSFLNTLRTLSMQMTVTKWLEQVYTVTDYPAYVLSQSDGEARNYALMSLVNWATRFEAGRRQGLRAFVSYIDELSSGKDQTTEIDLSEPLENVVRCMTIHKSKGLEFPYVFLCGIQSSQRKTDRTLILSEKGTMSAKRFIEDVGLTYEPHDYYLLAKEETRESEAEKIRLLYVALTRAEEKVFVISLIKRNAEEMVSEAATVPTRMPDGVEKYPPVIMAALNTHLKRFLAGQVGHAGYPLSIALTSAEPVYYGDLEFGGPSRNPDTDDLALISDTLTNMVTVSKAKARPVAQEYEAARNRRVDVAFSEEEQARLDLLTMDVNEWAEPEKVPSKTTVSEMKRLLSEEESDEDFENVEARAVNMRVRESEEKWKGNGYTASRLGTLLHSAWQYLDFSGLLKAGTDPDWTAELEKLSEFGMITKDQIPILSEFTEGMQAFFESSLCRKMTEAETRKENGPYREIPFALARPNENEDFSLVQGMIDCWFVDEDGDAVLIDYKSDRLSGTDLEKLAELKKRYQVQLDMYAQAITAATGKRVKSKIIWLIRDGLSFEL